MAATWLAFTGAACGGSTTDPAIAGDPTARPAAGPVEVAHSAPPSAAQTTEPCTSDNLTQCRDKCRRGDEASCYRLATAVQRGSRIGGPEESEYVPVFQRTCDGDGPNAGDACGRLAYLLFLSPNLRNAVRAFEYGKRACERGSSLGCLFLAREHRESGWVARAKNFERACTLGDSDGCVEGGMTALEGRDGLPPDTPAGLKMLDSACGRGVAVACAHLASLYDRGSVKGGKPTEVKPDAARWEVYRRRYCDLAGQDGHGVACR